MQSRSAPDQRAERQLVAVVAADIAGYSRLMGVDEEGTLSRLKACRRDLIDPGISWHRGRIVKTTGDGMLVEFASVLDALRVAAAVQDEMARRNMDIAPERRIEFRIGIHQGDIVVEDGDIFGDGVNVAARLESIAKPGGIVISEAVHSGVGNRLDLRFEDMGKRTLKNIDKPVRAYAVVLDTMPEAEPADGRAQRQRHHGQHQMYSEEAGRAVLPGSLVLPDVPQERRPDDPGPDAEADQEPRHPSGQPHVTHYLLDPACR